MKKVNYLKEKVYKHRKILHNIAEEGRKEYKTFNYIKSILDDLGIESKKWLETGLAGIIKGKNPQKTIAFRADMDGLMSSDKTVKHLCGHDGHMSILLGLIEYINDNKEHLNDNFVFIFQPAEEGPGGSRDMVKNGIIEYYGIDEIYGLHVNPLINEGIIGIRKKAIMAGTVDFEIDIISKSAHGAMPQNGIDGVVISAELINSIQTIISRNISPIDNAVITIGKINGGARRNIVAENIHMEGTIRYAKEEIREKILDRVEKICIGIENKYDCKIIFSIVDECPAVINNDRMYDEFKLLLKDRNIKELELQMGAEDFSFFQKAVPGFFFNIGTRNKEKGYTAVLHSEEFNFDENIILQAMDIYVELLELKGMLER
ncbi:M20 metallopeptidase family protein [Peptacetobacter sp.]|uniref:M20 metallopeptidase family protein n=1 Tax=Peptacetobacter sp. TaxID=2991975 RepID=UPI002615ED43|nr:amidohydrolase [Peptacetobacter sp.]